MQTYRNPLIPKRINEPGSLGSSLHTQPGARIINKRRAYA